MKIIDYMIVFDNYTGGMENGVKAALSVGWELYGPLNFAIGVHNNCVYSQALVKYDKNVDEEFDNKCK